MLALRISYLQIYATQRLASYIETQGKPAAWDQRYEGLAAQQLAADCCKQTKCSGGKKTVSDTKELASAKGLQGKRYA